MMMSPLEFAKTLEVVNVARGSIPFEPNLFQETFLEEVAKEPDMLLAVSPRQYGKSTASTAAVLWKLMFFPNTTAFIVAPRQNYSVYSMNMVMNHWHSCTTLTLPAPKQISQSSIAFYNGSVLKIAGLDSIEDKLRPFDKPCYVLFEEFMHSPLTSDDDAVWKMFDSLRMRHQLLLSTSIDNSGDVWSVEAYDRTVTTDAIRILMKLAS